MTSAQSFYFWLGAAQVSFVGLLVVDRAKWALLALFAFDLAVALWRLERT